MIKLLARFIANKDSSKRVQLEDLVKDNYGQFVEPLYKAEPPFMAFEEGFGYQGVVLIDRKTDKLQCHLCGEWYDRLTSSHLKAHKTTAKKYKELVGLYPRTSLINEAQKKMHSELQSKRYKKPGLLERQRENLEKARSMRDNGAFTTTAKHRANTMQHKNKYGICDAQLKFRMERFLDDNGHLKFKQLPFRGSLLTRFGSYQKAYTKLGFASYINQSKLR